VLPVVLVQLVRQIRVEMVLPVLMELIVVVLIFIPCQLAAEAAVVMVLGQVMCLQVLDHLVLVLVEDLVAVETDLKTILILV
jgi:hypothetical protein